MRPTTGAVHLSLFFGTHPAGQHSLDSESLDHLEFFDEEFQHLNCLDHPPTVYKRQVLDVGNPMNRHINQELGSQAQGMHDVLVGPTAASFDFGVAIQENAALGDLKRRFNNPSNVSSLLSPEVPSLLREIDSHLIGPWFNKRTLE